MGAMKPAAALSFLHGGLGGVARQHQNQHKTMSVRNPKSQPGRFDLHFARFFPNIVDLETTLAYDCYFFLLRFGVDKRSALCSLPVPQANGER